MTRLVVGLLIGVLLAGCASTAEREAEGAKRQRLVDTDVQLAAGYLQRGQIEFAKEKLDKALAIEPNDTQANNMMALLQWRLKDYNATERYFRRAIDAEQANGEAQNNFGVFLCERGRIDEAEQSFKRAIANPLYSTPATANQNAGLCVMRKGDRAAAEKYFRAALAINPQLGPSLEQMAHISFDSGHTLAARGFLQRFFQDAKGDSPGALLLAVRVERAFGHKDQEASYAVRLRAKYPESPEAKELQRLTRAGKK